LGILSSNATVRESRARRLPIVDRRDTKRKSVDRYCSAFETFNKRDQGLFLKNPFIGVFVEKRLERRATIPKSRKLKENRPFATNAQTNGKRARTPAPSVNRKNTRERKPKRMTARRLQAKFESEFPI